MTQIRQGAARRRTRCAGAAPRRQQAAAGPLAARVARPSRGARTLAGGQAGHRASLRTGGDRQAPRRPARDAVSASGRTPDSGRLRPRIRSRLDGRGDGGGAGRGARALPGCRAASGPVAGDAGGAGAGGRASPRRPCAAAPAPHPQRIRQRPLCQRRADDHPQSAHGKAERLDPPLPIERSEPSRRAAAATPCPHVLRAGGAGGKAARSRHRGRDRPAHLARLASDRADRCRRAGDCRRTAPAAAVGGQMPHQRSAGAGGGGDRDRRPFPAGRARAGRAVRGISAILRRPAPSAT